MSQVIQELRDAGLLCYGSVELAAYETRLSRFFSREYAPYLNQPDSFLEEQIVTNQGVLAVRNEELMDEHYDKHVSFFKSFLDRHYMAYTMAYYGEVPENIVNSTISLETAQRDKFRLICERAGIRGEERILNLGCGFGAFETYLFENYDDIRITSVTSSRVQAEYLQQCFDDPKHPIKPGRCRLLHGVFGSDENKELCDGSYDAVFAIGLFEHINNLHEAFGRISRLLVPGGYCFLHLIVSVPAFPQYQDSSKTLIGRYFPGGRVWPFHVIGKDNAFFALEHSWYLNGMNYWKTLDEWHRRYWRHMGKLFGRTFDVDAVRYWNDYFILCKAVLFAPLMGAVYGNGHFLFRVR